MVIVVACCGTALSVLSWQGSGKMGGLMEYNG